MIAKLVLLIVPMVALPEVVSSQNSTQLNGIKSEFKILVNPGIGVREMSEPDIFKALSGKDTRFDAVALQRPFEGEILQRFVRMSISDFQRNWLQQASAGPYKQKPVYSKSANSIAKYVARNSGAIAIVNGQDWTSLSDVSGVVEVIILKGKLPKVSAAVQQSSNAIDTGQKRASNGMGKDAAGIENLYQAAVNAQAQGLDERAIVLFNQLEQREPNYKDVKTRLESLQQKRPLTTAAQTAERAQEIPKRPSNSEASSVTEEAAKPVNNIKHDTAPAPVVTRKAVVIAKKPTESSLSATGAEPVPPSSSQVALEPASKPSGHPENSEARAHHERALLAIEQRDFEKALSELDALRDVAPNYSDLNELISSCEKEMLIHQRLDELKTLNYKWQNRNHPRTDTAWKTSAEMADLGNRAVNAQPEDDTLERGVGIWAAAVASIFLIPIIGLVVSPSIRAETFLLLGVTTRAMGIYERMLMQHPERLSLYLKLADIYLLLGRQDATAIRVFSAVLQLRLATPNLGQIRSVVARNQATVKS